MTVVLTADTLAIIVC